MQDTAGEVRTNSYANFSYGPLYMDMQVLVDEVELLYNSFVWIECSLEDLPKAMDDREKWQERVREICASNTTR